MLFQLVGLLLKVLPRPPLGVPFAREVRQLVPEHRCRMAGDANGLGRIRDGLDDTLQDVPVEALDEREGDGLRLKLRP